MLYIGIEGTDFIGKDTCIERFLEGYKYIYDIFYTREPGGSKLGKKIREIILDPNNEMSKLTEALLYAADRSIHIENIIKNNVHDIVLSNRTFLSSLIYQADTEFEADRVAIINEIACYGATPDYVIVFYIEDKDKFIERVSLSNREKDRIESRGIDYLYGINQKYRSLKNSKYGDKIILIECSGTKDEVYKKFVKEFNNILTINDMTPKLSELIKPKSLEYEFTDEQIKDAKYWFGQGEVNVNLMISSGTISLDNILKMYKREVLDKE